MKILTECHWIVRKNKMEYHGFSYGEGKTEREARKDAKKRAIKKINKLEKSGLIK